MIREYVSLINATRFDERRSATMEKMITPINAENSKENTPDEYFGCGAVDVCDTCQSICAWNVR